MTPPRFPGPPGGIMSMPARPQRQLDTVSLEGLDDLVDPDAPSRAQIKSRDFPELYGLDVGPGDATVVLYDADSMDSFAACFAAHVRLGQNAKYFGVSRGWGIEDLPIDVSGEVVAMLGVSWSMEAMHDLVAECGWLLILDSQSSMVRELQGFNYPSAIKMYDADMGAGPMGWNFFFPGDPVPSLLRALEDAELGRRVFRDALAFADGFEATLDLELPFGEVAYNSEVFQAFELHLHDEGRSVISRSIEEGLEIGEEIQQLCREVGQRMSVRTLRAFPAWRCALLNSATPFASRVAEHLAAQLVQQRGADSTKSSFGMIFEVRKRTVRATLHSLPGGPDVSEVAAAFEGWGRPHLAVFTVTLSTWEEMWLQSEPVLWDTDVVAPGSLRLRSGDLIYVAQSDQRFEESPFDCWSWGYRADDPSQEGWFPTLAHTLLLATANVAASADGVKGLQAGDLIVAQGQLGEFVWGWKFQPGCKDEAKDKGWYPRMGADDALALEPVSGASSRAVVFPAAAGA